MDEFRRHEEEDIGCLGFEGPLRNHLKDPVREETLHRVWSRVQTRLDGHSRARWLPRVSMAQVVASCGVACLALALGWVMLNGRPGRVATLEHADEGRAKPSGGIDTGALVEARPSTGALDRDGGALPQRLRVGRAVKQRVWQLSDGSRIALSKEGTLQLRANTGTRFDTHLVQGAVHMHVQPHGPRRWTVLAGDVRVEVVGTSFWVERGADEVAVRVERGVVEVHSDRLMGGMHRLTAGESIALADANQANAVSRGTGSSARDLAKGTARGTRSSARLAEPVSVHGGAGDARASGNPSAGDLTTEGAFSPWVLAEQDMAEGDVVSAYRRLTEALHGDLEPDKRAMTHFFAARIALRRLGAFASAARHFRQSREWGLSRSMAEEALALEVQALGLAGDVVEARGLAAHYRAQHPEGIYAERVQLWADPAR